MLFRTDITILQNIIIFIIYLFIFLPSVLIIPSPEGEKHEVKNWLERLLIVTGLCVQSASESDLDKPLY